MTPVCSVDGCDRPVQQQLLCGMHRMRLRRHGDVQVNQRHAQRFVLTNTGRAAIGVSRRYVEVPL